jgi:uracil-DNA glycosylase
MQDLPYALKSEIEMQRRRAMLGDLHMVPLAAYRQLVQDLAGEHRSLPDFDPCDGGVNAKVLFLLEAPGRRAVGSTFISRNNPDQTAKNMLELLRDAGIPRADTLLWNIVPWYIGDGKRIRAAQRADLAESLPHLADLLALLRNLRAVVLVGKKAGLARHEVARLTSVPIYDCPHPSPKVFNIFPRKREEARAVMGDLLQHL